MTVSTDPKNIAAIVAIGGGVAKPDTEPVYSDHAKREIAKAIATIYESLRDLPRDAQARILVASAVLLGRADDLVERLTGKVRS